MALYSLELRSLPKENPILIEILHNEGFSVNRTGNSFSGVGVDMTLEQTINAEAKNPLKDIMSYLDIASAVNRSVVTNSMKNQLVNSLLELVDLKHTIDGSKESRQSRIETEKYDLENTTSLLRLTLNLFCCRTDKNVLFNPHMHAIFSQRYCMKCVPRDPQKKIFN